jgi:tetratricopeptide (TPR) repeat protein
MSAPSQADTLCDQARTARQEGRLGDALKLFEQAIAHDDRCLPAWEGRAYLAFSTRDFPTAIECFRKVSTLDIRRVQPMINLGAVYNRVGDFNGAVKSLRQAISRDRKSAEAYYNLGIAHKGLNQLSLAVSAYKEAIKVSPDMHDAHQNLANVYSEMGNIAQARQHYQKALAIKPDFEPARRGLARLEDTAETEKKKFSPFGRLVDTEELANRKADAQVRELNVHERFEDRQEKHRLTKEAVHAAQEVIGTLRDRLEPLFQRLAANVAERTDKHTLVREFEAFRDARQKLEHELGAMERITEDLRTHEKFIRDPG